MLQGISVSPGIVLKPALVLKEEDIIINENKISESQIQEQKEKFIAAREATIKQLEKIRDKAARDIGEDKAAIFDGHIALIEDEEFEEEVFTLINDEFLTADNATNFVLDQQAQLLDNLEDEYLKERAADIRDICSRLLRNILNLEIIDLGIINEEVVLVAHDLTPSQTAQLSLDKVKAFVTNIGGRTSHTSIMARSLEIPAIVGVTNITNQVKNGDLLIVNANDNVIIINPTAEQIQEAQVKLDQHLLEINELNKFINVPAVTLDGRHIELAANIGTVQDVTGAINHGAQGIGLYRSEFLFMDRTDYPSEEEQYQAYSIVAQKMEGKPVIVRTMDIGGDKELPYMNLAKELNPFLGYRAIRIGFDQPESFKTQLRALLRAATQGNILVMFPMVISVSEVLAIKKLIQESKAELTASNIAFKEDLTIGVMIETPAAAVVADLLIKHVDFFSIGTNDLTQYTLAVDRGNELISHLYDPFNPAVLRLIQSTITASHNANKWTGMCGEFAGDELATALLIGLGLDEFSMSSISLSKIKRIVNSLNFKDCEELVQKALQLENSEQIKELVTNFYVQNGIKF